MQGQPDRAELLEAVANFIRNDALPNLEGRPAFLARVAANAVDIVRRELEQGQENDAALQERLAALLERDGDLNSLNEELCDRIAHGGLTLETPGLADYLWDLTMREIAVDQPKYASYRRALEQAGV
jgi:hypothetical protein